MAEAVCCGLNFITINDHDFIWDKSLEYNDRIRRHIANSSLALGHSNALPYTAQEIVVGANIQKTEQTYNQTHLYRLTLASERLEQEPFDIQFSGINTIQTGELDTKQRDYLEDNLEKSVSDKRMFDYYTDNPEEMPIDE